MSNTYGIFRTLVIFTDTMDQATIDEYATRRIVRYAKRYKEKCWAFLYQQDVRARLERLPRIYSKAYRDKQRGLAKSPPEVHPMDLSRPWEYCFIVLINDSDWWREEFEEPAQLLLNHFHHVQLELRLKILVYLQVHSQ